MHRQHFTNFLHALPIALDDETTSRTWTVVSSLAARHRLTAYDATYLELAERLGLPLATRDKALITAAAVDVVIVLES